MSQRDQGEGGQGGFFRRLNATRLLWAIFACSTYVSYAKWLLVDFTGRAFGIFGDEALSVAPSTLGRVCRVC